MQPFQQIVEQPAAVAVLYRPSREGAAKRRGNSSLVGQAFDTDDASVHVKLGRRLLQFGFVGH
jgi:hypothetical protein